MTITAKPASSLFPDDIIAPGAFKVLASAPCDDLPGFTEVSVVDVLDNTGLVVLFPSDEYVETFRIAA